MEQVIASDDGVQLWTDASGSGTPLILCHGGPGGWDMYAEMADTLGDHFAVHRWDQRGCGRSQRSGPYSVARTIADLDALHAAVSPERIVLLGHAWGAQLALRYAIERPEAVKALIYLGGPGTDEPSTWYDPYHETLRRRLADSYDHWAALRRIERSPSQEREFLSLRWAASVGDLAEGAALAQRLTAPWLGVNHQAQAALQAETSSAHFRSDVQTRSAWSTIPVLLLDGDLDPHPRWALDSLEKALPWVHRVELLGLGHLTWMEDPTAFKAAILAFTREVGAI